MTSTNQTWTKFLPSLIRRRIEGRYNLQKIISNIGWLFFDKVLRMGMGLIVGVWVARYLGPSQFGVLNYAVAFVSLFVPLAALGLDTIVIRDMVKEPASTDETLGAAFVLRLIGGLVAGSLAIAIIFFLRPADDLTRLLVVIIAVTAPLHAFDTIDFWFQAQVQSKYTVIARNSAFLLMTGGRVLLILWNAPLVAFALASLGENILGIIGLVIAYRAKGYNLKFWRSSLSRTGQLLKQSWPLILSGLSVVIYMKIDQVMLGEMVESQAVGLYAAAVRISEIWYFIPVTIVSSVFPAIIQAKKSGEDVYYQKLQKLFSLMTALSVSIATPMAFLSTPIVVILYGQDYAAAGTILAIHIWAALFVSMGVAQNPWDVTENLTKFALQRTVIGAVINVLLNFMLIPAYAGIGAAIATVIAYAFSAFILNLIRSKTRRIFVLQAKSFFFIWNLTNGKL